MKPLHLIYIQNFCFVLIPELYQYQYLVKKKKNFVVAHLNTSLVTK